MNYVNVGLVGSGASGSYHQPQTAMEARTIPTVLDEQAKSVGELHDTIGQLELRLNIVLGPDPDISKAESSAPAPNPIHVLDRVQDHTRGLNLAMSRLHRLMQRLQV